MCAIAANFAARYQRDGAAARRYFDVATQSTIHSPGDLSIIASAVLIAEGNKSAAAEELKLAEAALKQRPEKIAAAMREDIEELRLAMQA